MTSKDAMSIFYLKQEAESIKNEIAYCKAYSIELNATDVLKAINYDGMPHSPNRSQSAPFEADIIRLVDNANELMERLTELLAKKLKEINRLSNEFETFVNGFDDPKIRSIIRLRCMNGFSWDKVGECLRMDRRSASTKFYKAFGEEKKIEKK